MNQNPLDTALWGLPLCYVESPIDAKSLDIALWGMPMSTNIANGDYYFATVFT